MDAEHIDDNRRLRRFRRPWYLLAMALFWLLFTSVMVAGLLPAGPIQWVLVGFMACQLPYSYWLWRERMASERRVQWELQAAEWRMREQHMQGREVGR